MKAWIRTQRYSFYDIQSVPDFGGTEHDIPRLLFARYRKSVNEVNECMDKIRQHIAAVKQIDPESVDFGG